VYKAKFVHFSTISGCISETMEHKHTIANRKSYMLLETVSFSG